MKCYAKTGTATENIDCWFAGGTPYYVASCWFGFDQSAAVNPSSLAKQMWVNVMKRVHAKLEPKEFVDSEFITRRYYCKETGLLATDKCTKTGLGCYKTTYSLPAPCSAHEGTLLPEYKEPDPNQQGNGQQQNQPTTPSQPNSSTTSSTTSSSNSTASSSTNSTTSSNASSTTSSTTSSTSSQNTSSNTATN
jgi:penicillin-binding protein 1A